MIMPMALSRNEQMNPSQIARLDRSVAAQELPLHRILRRLFERGDQGGGFGEAPF